MAKTLLTAVNDLLTKTRHISGTDGKLTSLTDASRQVWIDGAVLSLRYTLQELYSQAREPLPKVGRIFDLVLKEDKRTYAIDDTAAEIRWPLRDEDNGQYIYEHRRGYYGILDEQMQPDQFTGLPYYGAIEPVRRDIYMDRIPTSAEAGRIYKVHYRTILNLAGEGDVFPFNDEAVDALVQSATEVYRNDYHNSFDEGIYLSGMARAGGLMKGAFARGKY